MKKSIIGFVLGVLVASIAVLASSKTKQLNHGVPPLNDAKISQLERRIESLEHNQDSLFVWATNTCATMDGKFATVYAHIDQIRISTSIQQQIQSNRAAQVDKEINGLAKLIGEFAAMSASQPSEIAKILSEQTSTPRAPSALDNWQLQWQLEDLNWNTRRIGNALEDANFDRAVRMTR